MALARSAPEVPYLPKEGTRAKGVHLDDFPKQETLAVSTAWLGRTPEKMRQDVSSAKLVSSVWRKRNLATLVPVERRRLQGAGSVRSVRLVI